MNKHILVVLSDPDAQRLLKFILKKFCDCSAETAGNGRDALLHLEKVTYAGMLLEMRLPVVDGIEVLRQARRLYPSLPIVMITGSLRELHEQVIAEGAKDVIYFPLEIDRVKEVAERWFKIGFPLHLARTFVQGIKHSWEMLTDRIMGRRQRELDDLRKRVAWIEKIARSDYNFSFINLLTPISMGCKLLEEELGALFANLAEGNTAKANESREMCSEVLQMIRKTELRVRSLFLEITDLVYVAGTNPQFSAGRLSEIVQRAWDHGYYKLRDRAASKRIALEVAGLADLPQIKADDRLLRILLHLIGCAIDEMREGGSITVRGEIKSHEHSVLLHLTFSEIAAEALTKAWGIGQWWGLAVHVAEAHGEKAAMQSQPAGGTTLTLSFPIESTLHEHGIEESGKTERLFAAVRGGDAARIKEVIEQGAAVNAKDADGKTPLHFARNLDCADADALLKAGADVNAQDNEGRTPLHLAVERFEPAMVRLLLEAGAAVTATDRHGETPLQLAVRENHATIVEILRNAEGMAAANVPTENGRTPVQSALSAEDEAIVQRLRDPGVPLDPKDLMRFFGPAHISMYAHSQCAEALLQQIVSKGNVIDPEQTQEYEPSELIGRYRDITHCDQCGAKFQAGDNRYISYFVLEPDELRMWQEVKSEDKGKSQTQ